MASPPRLPPKKDVALALLEQSTVFVHLDPRSEEVRVPPGFKKQPQLVLQIGHGMAPPIPDLDVSEDGISCTLSFNKMPHFCWIPWGSVFALVGDNARGMVWPDDVPREVSAQAAQQRPESKPALRAVPNKTQPAAVAPAEDKEEKPKKKRARKTAKDEAKKGARPAAARPAPVEAKASPPAPARGASATGTSADGDKRRRALPPYLRVIK